MKSAGFIALALSGMLTAAGAMAFPRQTAAPNSIYVREARNGGRAVMGPNGQWNNLSPEEYSGAPQGPPGTQGPQGPQDYDPSYQDPRYQGGGNYGGGYGGDPGYDDGMGQGGLAPGGPFPPQGPPPNMGPPVGPGGPGVGPDGPPPPVRGGGCGRMVMYGGQRYCGGAIIQEEGFEEYNYREYNRREDVRPTGSPFGPLY